MTTKPKAVAIAVAFASIVAILGFQIHARLFTHVGGTAPAPFQLSAASSDLRQLMESRVHQDYTAMSFTIWHDRPLTREKMDSIAIASGHIAETAQTLQTFEATYKQQGWSAQDVKFFDDKRLQLSRVAEQLSRAARNHNESQVVSFFMHLDNTCQSCHKRFRPDLSWT